ncbi:hypothetical protein DF108_30090 [Burkholderia stagnalis]|nr:hypothetical protein DF108_30090 [Burkholderia stagnalis]
MRARWRTGSDRARWAAGAAARSGEESDTESSSGERCADVRDVAGNRPILSNPLRFRRVAGGGRRAAGGGWRAAGGGWRVAGEGRRATGEGRRATGDGRRATGDGRRVASGEWPGRGSAAGARGP